MRKLSLFILIFITHTAFSQEVDTTFHKSLFRYKEDELPFSFGLLGSIGSGTLGATGGIGMEADVYHILFGYRHNWNGILNSKDLGNENSFYAGYMFRDKYVMISAGAGYGWLKYKCRSGMNVDCYGVDESTHGIVPLKFGFDVIIASSFALGIAYNGIILNNDDLHSIQFVLKIGIFREEYW